jgi:hypothetical protein
MNYTMKNRINYEINCDRGDELCAVAAVLAVLTINTDIDWLVKDGGHEVCGQRVIVSHLGVRDVLFSVHKIEVELDVRLSNGGAP